MQVIVADTTPVRYLTEIGHLDLLPRLFETISIPSIVYGRRNVVARASQRLLAFFSC
jgi:predicted nucleic acid-binding protein